MIAKSLTDKEVKIVLATVSQDRYAERNRAIVLMSTLAGMRVGEIAALRIGDVLGSDGGIKEEIHLKAEQTKGNRGRVVILGIKLRKELSYYAKTLPKLDHSKPLFFSQQKREGFSANTLCQFFHELYKRAGINGASSHSGRRSFITTLANKGVGVRVLMALAGHRHMSTTQRYIDINDEMLKAAANLI